MADLEEEEEDVLSLPPVSNCELKRAPGAVEVSVSRLAADRNEIKSLGDCCSK
jgi:hypothetical protein